MAATRVSPTPRTRLHVRRCFRGSLSRSQMRVVRCRPGPGSRGVSRPAFTPSSTGPPPPPPPCTTSRASSPKRRVNASSGSLLVNLWINMRGRTSIHVIMYENAISNNNIYCQNPFNSIICIWGGALSTPSHLDDYIWSIFHYLGSPLSMLVFDCDLMKN